MNFIKTEEKLIREQEKISNEIKQLEMLSKIDTVINKIENKMPEQISCTIKTSEQLSKDGTIQLPLPIRGKMLGIGRHKSKFYTKEELMKSVETFKNITIQMPCKVDHKIKEVMATIGAIDRLFWDETEQVIKYEGHINDETQARNILDRVVKEVSASIFSEEYIHPVYGFSGKELEYGELSLVEKGSFKGNTLEAVV